MTDKTDELTGQEPDREGTDEAEREDPEGDLDELDQLLELHGYPTTTQELINAFGDHEVETRDGWSSLEELLEPVENRSYDSADAARRHILDRVNR